MPVAMAAHSSQLGGNCNVTRCAWIMESTLLGKMIVLGIAMRRLFTSLSLEGLL